MTCRIVNGIQYSSADMNIECNSNFWKNNVFPVNLVLVLFMGLNLPIFIWIQLLGGKNYNLFDKINFQRKYGILFMELKSSKYYWEMVSIFTVNIFTFINIFKIKIFFTK